MAEMHRSLSRLRSLAPVLLGKEVPTHAHTDGLAACFVGVDRGRLRHLVPYPRAGPHYPPTPPPPPPTPAATGPVPGSAAAPPTSLIPGEKPVPPRDLSRLTPLQQQMYFGAQRGADWLFRLNRTDGRFVYGYLPAVSAVMEGDHYLRQAGAAFALARAARFTSEERYVARATQAVLTLLGDTGPDAKDSQVRYPSLPQAVVNRLAAAGLLVLAINELPSPQEDLL